MRITKKQIRQIIKESFADAVNQGRAQSRAREKAEFGPNADRTLGIYASTSLLGRFEDAMDRLYEDIYSNALEDLEDSDEAVDLANEALLHLVQKFIKKS